MRFAPKGRTGAPRHFREAKALGSAYEALMIALTFGLVIIGIMNDKKK